MNINLTEEDKIRLLNPEDAYGIMQRILLHENEIDQEKEHFWIIGLDNAHSILFIELVSLGSVNAAQIEPMNVFRVAVLKGAMKVILVHNHPSGVLDPSVEDKDITDRLIQVGRILNIEVIEHLIISTKSFISFARSSLFEELKSSTRWVPHFELIERIRKEEQEIGKEAVQLANEKGREEGGKHKAIEMAKGMKAKGIDQSIIVEVSKLSEQEIIDL